MEHGYDELRTYKDERVNVSRHFQTLDFYGVSFSYDRLHVKRHPIGIAPLREGINGVGSSWGGIVEKETKKEKRIQFCCFCCGFGQEIAIQLNLVLILNELSATRFKMKK
jgi:hypothetical protein